MSTDNDVLVLFTTSADVLWLAHCSSTRLYDLSDGKKLEVRRPVRDHVAAWTATAISLLSFGMSVLFGIILMAHQNVLVGKESDNAGTEMRELKDMREEQASVREVRTSLSCIFAFSHSKFCSLSLFGANELAEDAAR